jgi:hypothetical protein
MLQKLGTSPLYWLHSLEIVSGFIASADAPGEAIVAAPRMAPADTIGIDARCMARSSHGLRQTL